MSVGGKRNLCKGPEAGLTPTMSRLGKGPRGSAHAALDATGASPHFPISFLLVSLNH